eukprot:TRINITY_DN57339_c0_g1_i1.p1 TRINITY_DN57339_c0_g1~~TRINITY_DN57339_c0_g1_i1.p1  ORF type:complete len:526 (-),score=76.23 TRINITY_DN57339_c0_g1_i1:142-1689(-)
MAAPVTVASGCGYAWPPKCSSGSLPLGSIGSEEVKGEEDCLTRCLQAAGMTGHDAAEKRRLLASAARRLLAEGGAEDAQAQAYWVPGRIEVAGKHTDYAGGRSLLVAASRGFAVVAVPRQDATCRIFTTLGANHRRESAILQISKDLEPQHGHWAVYPAVTIRRLARNFGISLGVDIAVERDLPESSGMSSSSALVCFMWLILAERNNIYESKAFRDNLRSPEELFSFLGCIENGQDCGSVLVGDKGVGTFGGSEDHTAIMSSEAGKLKLFSYCPTTHEASYNCPASLIFVVGVSGSLARKTGEVMADYNNSAFLARDAAAAWADSAGELPLAGATFVPGHANLAEVVRHVRKQGLTGDALKAAVGAAIDRVDDGQKYGPKLGVKYKIGALRERFEQFFDESEVLTSQLAAALGTADLAAIGKASDESHRQAVQHLRNTIPETAWLPEEARRLGAVGASAFGAGFGGSCWALVHQAEAEAFAIKWREAYVAKFPRWAESCLFFCMRPGPGALRMP